MFGLSMRKILTVFGAAMMLFVIANVQLGSVAPRVIDGAEGYKLDAFLMFEPSCSLMPLKKSSRPAELRIAWVKSGSGRAPTCS